MRKFTYSTPGGYNGQGQAQRGRDRKREREEGKARCYRNASPPSLPILLPFLPRISRKAVLSRCGNFIFATNLQSLLAPCLPPVIPLFGGATPFLARVKRALSFVQPSTNEQTSRVDRSVPREQSSPTSSRPHRHTRERCHRSECKPESTRFSPHREFLKLLFFLSITSTKKGGEVDVTDRK